MTENVEGNERRSMSPPHEGQESQGIRAAFYRMRRKVRSQRTPRVRPRSQLLQRRQSWMPPMEAFRARAGRRLSKMPGRRREEGEDGAQQAELASNNSRATGGQTQPGLFARMMRRTQSKDTRAASRPGSPSQPGRTPSTPAQKEEVQKATSTEETVAAKAKQRRSILQKAHTLRSRFHPEPTPVPAAATGTEEKKVEAYVPTHAASDFCRVVVIPRDITARYQSLDEASRPSISSVPSEHPDPVQENPESEINPENEVILEEKDNAIAAAGNEIDAQREGNPEPKRIEMERRGTAFSLDTLATDTGFSGVQEVMDKTNLQPPPTPKATTPEYDQSAHNQAFKLTSDPQEPLEHPGLAELSDYQKFVQKAMDEELKEREIREHQQETWRILSQRVTPHTLVDPAKNCDIQRSGTFGDKARGGGRAKQETKAARKRASYMSHMSQSHLKPGKAAEPKPKRMSFQPGAADVLNVKSAETLAREARQAKRSSISAVSKRISGYLKPDWSEQAPQYKSVV